MAGTNSHPLDKTPRRVPYLRVVEPPARSGAEEGAASPDQRQQPDDAGQKRILIVEDEPGVRSLLEDIFFIEGYHTTAVADGREAFHILRDHQYDIVFTDMRLPGASGADVAKAVKTASQSTPVVVLTGWDTEPLAEELRDAGVDRILQKPFDMDEVIALVAELTRDR